MIGGKFVKVISKQTFNKKKEMNTRNRNWSGFFS